MSKSHTTTDHDEIRRWVEERDGKPATVRGTEKGHAPGVLRIDFEEAEADERLEAISWEDFFAKFEKEKLAFLYQEGESRFCKLVSR